MLPRFEPQPPHASHGTKRPRGTKNLISYAHTDPDQCQMLIISWGSTLPMPTMFGWCPFPHLWVILLTEWDRTITTITLLHHQPWWSVTSDLSSSRVKDTFGHTSTPAFSVDSELLRYFPEHADAFHILIYSVYPVLSWSSRLSLCNA